MLSTNLFDTRPAASSLSEQHRQRWALADAAGRLADATVWPGCFVGNCHTQPRQNGPTPRSPMPLSAPDREGNDLEFPAWYDAPVSEW